MTISVKDGYYTYDTCDDRYLLDDINISASSGDILAILGPNGSGKTTLLRCMMGFIRWDKGSTYIDDEDIKNIPNKALWTKMSYVPQARDKASPLDVKDMILIGRSSNISTFNMPRSIDYDAIYDISDRLGISHLLDKRCDEISGGELQLVLIARALVSNPDIILYDEPESNLDYKRQLVILDLMKKISADGKICIFNTHYPEHALRIANKAMILYDDSTYDIGKACDIVTEDNIKKAFGVKIKIVDTEVDGISYKDIIPIDYIR